VATPEERIAALEARVNGLEEWLKDIDAKLDQLIAVANMGKGAWWAMLKVGGLISIVIGAVVWLWQHIPWKV
jgi:hypothetical protein